MKRPMPTSYATDVGVVFLGRQGEMVGKTEFTSLRLLRKWLAYWRVVLDEDRDQLLALNPHYYPILRDYIEFGSAAGSLRINVVIDGLTLSSADAFRLVLEGRAEKAETSKTVYFRNGPVPRTGKGSPYCYFRSMVRTYPSIRDSYSYREDDYIAPPPRAARNATNLPTLRDDISRGQTRSWKKTRRFQWKAR